MEDLNIPFKGLEQAQAITDFAVKYPKGKITAKTPEQQKVASWLNEMKQKGGWFEMSVTTDRLKLIYIANAAELD